jgi:1-acyl-sn-glycerol-3-phosphate acyltransferase
VLRRFFSSIAFVFLTILGSVLAIPSGAVDRSRGDLVLWLARWWARGVLASAGVRVAVNARARLEPGRPYIFMANHLSSIDIWVALVAIPVSFRFIAKKQLGAIPLFGWAMRAGGFIFIDRQNPGLARRSIEKAEARIRAGESVVIFPEGTRSRDGRLGSFKKGGFHLAINSGAAIVPMAIHGTRELMPPGSLTISAGAVSIDIDEPIATAGMTSEEREALSERVRGRIAAMLGEGAGPDSVQHAQ